MYFSLEKFGNLKKKQYLCTRFWKKVQKLSEIWFKMGSNVWFLLRSRNTLGYGIHSPYLFYIARVILPETAQYYCFSDPQMVGNTKGWNKKKNELLFRLVNLVKAETIVEVGTAEMRTAYLQAPNKMARVLTDPSVLRTAPLFREAVESSEKELGTVDFAVMSAQDGLKTFETLAAHADEKSLFVVDDIRESKANWNVWKAVEANGKVTARMDLGKMGLVFFDPHFPKQTFRIRV